ncbi:hypothetical protein M422DRAFT_22940 [Sphaerobolus stellatus SS14]|nr:hypothetical protein M422DRAFT_22940 [Sphaerobolus stellatus SS14]
MKLVNTLITYAINRFVLTVCVVVFQAIILIVRPEDIWTMVIEFVAVALYTNSFLGTLNARNHLREVDASNTEYPSSSLRTGSRPLPVKGQGVMVTTTSTRTFDNFSGPVNLNFSGPDSEGHKAQGLELTEFGANYHKLSTMGV